MGKVVNFFREIFNLDCTRRTILNAHSIISDGHFLFVAAELNRSKLNPLKTTFKIGETTYLPKPEDMDLIYQLLDDGSLGEEDVNYYLAGGMN